MNRLRVFRKPTHALGWAFFALFLGAAPAACAEAPTIHLIAPTKENPAVIEVRGLSAATLAALKQKPPKDWTLLFAVRVGMAETAMLGSYSMEKDAIRFAPRFPLRPGLKYRVTFDPSQLPGGASAKPVVAEVALPKPPVVATGVVEQVYPTRNVLPENQLKFYIHFSRPMSRGEAYQRIRLLKANGQAVDRPFLELHEELWTPDGKRFTVFLHPGRIKSGLRPREELGPILENGKSYTLVIDAAWPDEDGNPLKAEFRKSFRAGKVDEEQPDPKLWKITAPTAGKTDPLLVQFPESLDHALLQRMLWVVDADGRRIVGTVRVGREETLWGFQPEQPWLAGKYRLQVNTALEDLAGNSIAFPFEIDLVRPLQRKIEEKVVDVPFAVR